MAAESSGLADLWDALRRRRALAVLIAVPMFAGLAAYTESLPNRYDGKTVVAFAPNPQGGGTIGADVLRLVIPKYVAFLTAPSTARTVAGTLGEREEVLGAALTASTSPDTANLTVIVRLGDPRRAAAAANAYAAEAVSLSRSDTQVRAEVVAPALVPTAPASPPRTLLLFGGAVLSVLTGGTAAVVADRSRPRVTDALSLSLATGHGTVGRIPVSRALRRSSPLAVLNDPAVGTAVRAMRTQLDQHSRAHPVKVVAVTSPSPGDGKTTVACLLAGALARVDASVLLIDADMRRPQLAQTLQLDPGRPGLADVLEERAALADVVHGTSIAGLSAVITERREHPGDLLARRLHAVLAEAGASYDVVVMDCPPILATDDARTLSLMADGTLLVVSAGSDLGRAAESATALDSLGVRMLGGVLNRSRRDGLGSYGSYRQTT